ncbi:MAG: GIY-YIG nuclease family protein [Chloroflexota bacterium]
MSAHLDALRLQARALPQCPGVYLWKDADDRTLYIGKAINLRARVASYFSNAGRDRRTRELLRRSRTIRCEVTETELEALFRESAMIKRERPEYNKLLLTAKRLFYLRLDVSQPDPYLQLVRSSNPDGAAYFGPFPSGEMARETVAYLHDVLPLRKCKAARPRCKPCIYFQMSTCAAPLIDEEHRRRHEEAIGSLFELLDGRSDRVLSWLERKRERLCESLLFEQAAEMQKRISVLRDHRKQHGILDAAVRCRCVVIRDDSERGSRAMLVAQGHVVSVRDLGGMTASDVAAWVTLHEPVLQSLWQEQNELDAATVLERWLRRNREVARWVAIPMDVEPEDLLQRAEYIRCA